MGWRATSRRRTPMATMTTNSAAGTRSTVGPDTIKNAFREMMDDEAKHVSFIEAALKKAGAPVPPKPTFKGLHDPIGAASAKSPEISRIPAAQPSCLSIPPSGLRTKRRQLDP